MPRAALLLLPLAFAASARPPPPGLPDELAAAAHPSPSRPGDWRSFDRARAAALLTIWESR